MWDGNWKIENDTRQDEERFLTSAGRPFHTSEMGEKSRPAPFGMTVGVVAGAKDGHDVSCPYDRKAVNQAGRQ